MSRAGRRAAVALAVVAGAILLPVIYARQHADHIYPGVTAGGRPVGGLTTADAAFLIAAQRPAGAAETPITLRDPENGRTWSFAPGDLGLVVDPAALAAAAYRVGRADGSPVLALLAPLAVRLRGHDVRPTGLVDEARARATLLELAPEVDTPPRDGDVRLAAGELVVEPPVMGHQLDVTATLGVLVELAADPGRRAADLAVLGTAPRIGDVNSVAEAYRQITAGPVRLTWRQGQVVTIPPEQLSEWVTIARRPNPAGDLVPSIVFDEAAIRAYLAPLAARIDRPVVEPRFQYDVNTARVTLRQPAEIGQQLDVAGSVARVIAAAYNDPRLAELAVRQERPGVSSDALPRLSGRLRLLSRSGTRLGGAPEGRARNLLLLVDRFHGLAVAPDGELSFLAHLGEVSAAAGFDMDHVTAGQAPRAAATLGGGVEQLATAAFRAAFWAGLPILERSAGATRSAWVEPPIGLDAAVAPSRTDLRFANDSGDYLLIQVAADAQRGALTWALYAVPGTARQVRLAGPRVAGLTAALEPVSRSSAALPAGSWIQVAWGRPGLEVTLERTVLEGGEIVRRDTFRSRYAASADVLLAGSAR